MAQFQFVIFADGTWSSFVHELDLHSTNISSFPKSNSCFFTILAEYPISIFLCSSRIIPFDLKNSCVCLSNFAPICLFDLLILSSLKFLQKNPAPQNVMPNKQALLLYEIFSFDVRRAIYKFNRN